MVFQLLCRQICSVKEQPRSRFFVLRIHIIHVKYIGSHCSSGVIVVAWSTGRCKLFHILIHQKYRGLTIFGDDKTKL